MISTVDMIARMQLVPYELDKGGLGGMDCWGLIEIWYEVMRSIPLANRGEIQGGPKGLRTGFDENTDWFEVDHPVDHDVVVMSTVVDRQKITAGHIGVFINGGVLHTEAATGCIFQGLDDRLISRRITGYFRHKDRY